MRPFMLTLQFPIYNGTLEDLKDTVVFLTRKEFISVSFSIASFNKKCASHVCRETAN